MTTPKLSPAKDIMAQKRQKKLAAALRTNLRRRKDQARDRTDSEPSETCDGAASRRGQAPDEPDRQG